MPKLLDQVRDLMRTRRYSPRTEQAYLYWIRRFILFHQKQHPSALGAPEVSQFLSYLARSCHVSASTQNQALAALLFLYRETLKLELPWLNDIAPAKRPARLPVVFTPSEVRRLLSQMQGTAWLMASLLYGSGLRLQECVTLRVKDLDFEYQQILVRNGKGAKDRFTILPKALIEPLQQHLKKVKELHEQDLCEGFGRARRLHA